MNIQEAVELYERTLHRGWWHRVATRLLGRSTQLLDLATVVAHDSVIARHYLGTQTVPVRQIRGSEGRRDTFDNAFHPLRPHTRGRWLNIAAAWLQGVALPPVELIRLGTTYFVRDGHHRISVVRAMGIKEIDAVVTAWEIAPVPSSAGMTLREAPKTPAAGGIARQGRTIWSTISWGATHTTSNSQITHLGKCPDGGPC